MKKNIKIFNLLLFACSNLHVDYPYVVPSADLNEAPRKIFEVTKLSATKSQDGVGICYGFTATSLLENYRCRRLGISCYDPAQQLSALDVTSHRVPDKKSLREFGFSRDVLLNISGGDRKIIKDSCLNYSQILMKKGNISNQIIGWDKLNDMWIRYKNSLGSGDKDCVHCMAVEIRNNMLNLKTSVDQIENALKFANSAEEFIYQSILPKECLQDSQKLQIPPFQTHSYPKKGSVYTAKDLSKKVETVLLNDVPLGLSICTSPLKNFDQCPDGFGHSIVLVGIRENCSKKSGVCKKYVRIRNSYGWDWQKKNNRGWVDLDELMIASSKNNKFDNQLTWVLEPGRTLEGKSL